MGFRGVYNAGKIVKPGSAIVGPMRTIPGGGLLNHPATMAIGAGAMIGTWMQDNLEPGNNQSGRGAGRAAFASPTPIQKQSAAVTPATSGVTPATSGLTPAQVNRQTDWADRARTAGLMSDLRGGPETRVIPRPTPTPTPTPQVTDGGDNRTGRGAGRNGSQGTDTSARIPALTVEAAEKIAGGPVFDPFEGAALAASGKGFKYNETPLGAGGGNVDGVGTLGPNYGIEQDKFSYNETPFGAGGGSVGGVGTLGPNYGIGNENINDKPRTLAEEPADIPVRPVTGKTYNGDWSGDYGNPMTSAPMTDERRRSRDAFLSDDVSDSMLALKNSQRDGLGIVYAGGQHFQRQGDEMVAVDKADVRLRADGKITPQQLLDGYTANGGMKPEDTALPAPAEGISGISPNYPEIPTGMQVDSTTFSGRDWVDPDKDLNITDLDLDEEAKSKLMRGWLR